MAWNLRRYLAGLPDARPVLTTVAGLKVTVSRMGMTGRDAVPADGLGLADAIGLLRDDLLKAQAAGAGSEIQLPVESMTVVLKITATKAKDGKAGLRSRSWSWSWGAAGPGARLGTDGDGRVRRSGGS